MTTDDFTRAARAEAEDYARTPRMNVGTVRDRIAKAYLAGAERGREQALAQEPTDAEVEAALTALLISECIALGQTADEAADYAIRELETRDLANLRTGVRCSLRAARAARRDKEK